jgi:hypothetical protein
MWSGSAFFIPCRVDDADLRVEREEVCAVPRDDSQEALPDPRRHALDRTLAELRIIGALPHRFLRRDAGAHRRLRKVLPVGIHRRRLRGERGSARK